MQNCTTHITDLQCLSFDSLFPQLFFHFLHVTSDQMTQKQTEEFVAQIYMSVKMYAVERKKMYCIKLCYAEKIHYVLALSYFTGKNTGKYWITRFLMIIFNYNHIS